MLRIEKVFLQGFKSFCDATEIVFDAEGITAVVGPNGCGKSNVSDALSWVIGEQRAKALRGGKMEDVIFQGSRNRPPSGLAEVILTLKVSESFEIRPAASPETPPAPSESAKEPLPQSPTESSSSRTIVKTPSRTYMPGEKITIGRRLYRTGESEYEMNGRTCRLRDIQDLFAGTGLGGAHYAIIEQGRIGQILSAKPLDRRILIEEAVGISKYKMRQRAAELKLDAAQHNLARVTDIIAEVERQQAALKRQAAKARRYQRLRGEMRELTKAVLICEYLQTQTAIQSLDDRRQIISSQETEIAHAIAQTEETRLVTVNLADQSDIALKSAREVVAETNLQIEKNRQQQDFLQAQINSLTQRTQLATQDQIAINERRQLLVQESERLREDLRAIEDKINTEAGDLSHAEKIHAEQSSQEHQTEKQLEAAQRNVTEAATQRERWNQLGRQFQDALARCHRTLTGLQAEHQRTTEQAQKIEADCSTALENLSQAEQKYQQILDNLLTAKQFLALKQTEAEASDTQLLWLQKQVMGIDHRLQSLIEIDERRAYFSEAVQSIIQASRDARLTENFNILGTLADFIKVSAKDEAMVEVGLREELQYLLTPSFEDALRAIEFLKREQGGRATFLVLNSTPANNSAASPPDTGHQIVRLIDLLGLKPDLRSIIQQALPRLSQTVVAEQLQQAIQASISTNGKGTSFLTATGEFVSAGHIISGGSLTIQGKGVLALKREIEELQSQGQDYAQQIKLAEEQNASLKIAVADAQEQTQLLDSQQREIEKMLVQQRGSLTQIERERERTATHLRVLETELQQAQTECAQVEEKLQQAETALSQAVTTLAEAEAFAATTGATVVQIRQLAAERLQYLSSRRADFAAKSERRKGLQQDIRRLENEAEDIHRRLNRIQTESCEAEEQTRSLSETLTNLDFELQELLKLQQIQLAQVEISNAQLAREKENLAQQEMSLIQARNHLTEIREKRSEIDISRTKLLASLEHLEAVCHAELGEDIPLLLQTVQSSDLQVRDPRSAANTLTDTTDFEESDADVLSHPFPTDLDSAKAHLEGLRTKVESIGPVNLLALQELGEQEDRLAFLLEQKADIEQAVSDTLTVIAELKKRSRERFIEAFHQINRNFSEMFVELFGGGHGEMRLIDESDVLESGIDIIAQPPGKRLQNVLLLSVGEKAMAALALVMGIFKYRPSPFCLLDEVDAPLDDVNISRFADKVLEMSRQTQFMVITHSKRTMEAARTLYGVTMEDPGVSKLISVRLT